MIGQESGNDLFRNENVGVNHDANPVYNINSLLSICACCRGPWYGAEVPEWEAEDAQDFSTRWDWTVDEFVEA